jgi:hypothetical protein
MLYIGQGKVRQRLSMHQRGAVTAANKRGYIFRDAAPLEYSWVLNDRWLEPQLLELENDLIAAHILVMGAAPVAQFVSKDD